MNDPETWGTVRNVDHIEAALNEERRKFQAETLRTSAAYQLLREFVDKLPEHREGPWSRGCDLCRLVAQAEQLLSGKSLCGDAAKEDQRG